MPLYQILYLSDSFILGCQIQNSQIHLPFFLNKNLTEKILLPDPVLQLPKALCAPSSQVQDPHLKAILRLLPPALIFPHPDKYPQWQTPDRRSAGYRKNRPVREVLNLPRQ